MPSSRSIAITIPGYDAFNENGKRKKIAAGAGDIIRLFDGYWGW